MRKLCFLLVLVIGISGCKTTFKSNFRDFNAYYNTYYNAKKSYNSGLKKSLEQARTYNTLQPIRVYETPKGAGASDFGNAIDKGASVLRKYKETKWVDNALEIIGKSYFYRSEYFNAIQKFDELYITAENEELKQQSVFWRGRVLLELKAFAEGIQYLNEQLSLLEGEWIGSLEYQTKTILAEHYIEQENYVNALDLLSESAGELPERAQKERAYFLLGQLNEILGNPEAAFDAYDQVERFYSNYDLQFAAKKKKAEVARDLGNTREAIKVFSSMVRDDKNTEFISELNYELGRTEQIQGNAEKAERIYLDLLRNQRNKPSANIKALTYNGLGELYQYDFDDYTLAAAYYDSSARMNIPENQLPESYNARELAQSFGEYADLKFQIYEQDSLLWLGSLSEEKFDSVLKEIESRKIAELEQLQREQEERRNTMVNVDASDQETETTNSRSGFLNIQNPLLIADAKEQFRAVWGNRPLVDNWRFNQLMQNTVIEDSALVENTNVVSSEQNLASQVTIDLSRVPFTPKEQDSVRAIKSEMFYELGNLFFLSLNLPDSAIHYFEKVIDGNAKNDIKAVTLYSLTELHDAQGNTNSAIAYANDLIELFPGSEYTGRVVEKYELQRPEIVGYTEANPRDEYRALTANEFLPDPIKAEQLASLAIAHKGEAFSHRALYDAITIYINLGKSDSVFKANYPIWVAEKANWESTKQEFSILQDSLREAFTDTTLQLSVADSVYYETMLDSTLTEPDIDQYFPYQGAYWDSTRTQIETFTKEFTSSNFIKTVRIWQQEFKVPEPEVEEIIIENEPVATDSTQVSLLDESGYINCTELEIEPQIRGGIATFNQVLNVPDGTEEEFITFRFLINQRGIVDEFELASETENERLVTAYQNAIESFITFEPVLFEGEAQMIACNIDFVIPK
ncbi:MAG: tetratricopeptide repeat protein [Balneolaceae bacterium]|nr:tetratricopeptide repeat protein [Balneolaceae bacterium]